MKKKIQWIGKQKEDWLIYRLLYVKVYMPIDNWRWSRRIEKRRQKAWKDFGKDLHNRTSNDSE
jgi:hypothetical protein